MESNDIQKKAECLAHHTFEKSSKYLLLTDIQGSDILLTDPEIATSSFANENNTPLFCVGSV